MPSARATIEPINALLGQPFAAKLATKDWHPADHVSFAANHPGSPEPFVSTVAISHPADPSRAPYRSTLWPVHCVQHTPGAELVPGLDMSRVDAVVCKGTDARVEMYSAFCDPFHFGAADGGGGGDVWTGEGVSDSGLAATLRAHAVTDVFVVGLAMDYCVKDTAIDAVRLGFRAWVVRQATRAVGGEDGARRAAEEMVRAGVRCVDLDGPEVGWVRALA